MVFEYVLQAMHIHIMSKKLTRIYCSPKGYWKGLAVIKNLSKLARVSEDLARKWLEKQAIWQIYLPPPKRIPRQKFDIRVPNNTHQVDLLYLPHDKVRGKMFKYT